MSEDSETSRLKQELEKAQAREEEALAREEEALARLQIAEEDLARLQMNSIAEYFSGRRHLPTLTRDGSRTNASINPGHGAVNCCTVKEFGILEMPADRLKLLKNSVSKILTKHDALGYSTELDVQVHVRSLMEDMIEAAGLEGELDLRCGDLEIADLKADIWIISSNGYPVGAVEIKKPSKEGAESTMNDGKVQGQLFDYMLRIRSFHGLRHVFGILTNFEEWRICWLPDSDDAAKATNLMYELDADNININAATERVLYCTDILTGSSAAAMPSLANSLVSVLSKMNYGKNSLDISKMILLSNDRSYILLDKKSWFWTSLQSADLKSIRKSMEVSLIPPGKGTKKFILLRDYHGGADGRVWLAAGASNGQLAVIKFLRRARNRPKNDELTRIQKELAAWGACDISAYSCKLGGRPAVVMPFLFHCNVDSTGRPFFIQSPDSWSGVPATAESKILFLSECQNALQNLDPRVVLRACVSRMAKAKYVHNDIEWRHVSVAPVFKKPSLFASKQFAGFISTFIDFGNIEKVNSQAEAEEKMKYKMEVLLNAFP